MACAADIVELRALGLSLREVRRVFEGDTQTVDRTLALHTAALEDRIRQLGDTISKVSRMRADLGRDDVLPVRDLIRLLKPTADLSIAFDLPWPWGGERFELRDIRSLNYIVGPLGSGKTQLAKRLAASLPDAVFVGLDRLADNGATAQVSLEADPSLRSRVETSIAEIVDDGGTESTALLVLLASLQSEGVSVPVIDMLEQGLDAATQEALINHLRRRGPTATPLFFLTRSSAILDLDGVGADEAIIFCPANHSPPSRVVPCPGSPGYEAVATCLASPEVRARTAGMMAQWPAR
jgi:hypothetical protein